MSSATQLSDGRSLTWTHVRRLIEVTDSKKRSALLRKVQKKAWTGTQLAEAITSARGGKQSKGGRKPAAPDSFAERVRQERRFLDEWQNRDREVWSKPEFSLAALGQAAPAGEVTDDLLVQVEQMREGVETILSLGKKRLAEVEQVLKTLMRKKCAAAR